MSALATIALNAGIPLVGKILSRRLGDDAGKLLTDVLSAVAASAGTTPEDLDRLADEDPNRVMDAMRVVEAKSPELIALYAAEVQLAQAALQSEQGEPLWARLWRPFGMYFIMFLWAWNAVILHVANAIWKIALPPMPWDILLGLSGLYFSLYMGGHTVKDIVSKWTSQAGNRQ
jgi:hypothetical protein